MQSVSSSVSVSARAPSWQRIATRRSQGSSSRLHVRMTAAAGGPTARSTAPTACASSSTRSHQAPVTTRWRYRLSAARSWYAAACRLRTSASAAYRSSRCVAPSHSSRTVSCHACRSASGCAASCALARCRTSGTATPWNGMHDFMYAWRAGPHRVARLREAGADTLIRRCSPHRPALDHRPPFGTVPCLERRRPTATARSVPPRPCRRAADSSRPAHASATSPDTPRPSLGRPEAASGSRGRRPPRSALDSGTHQRAQPRAALLARAAATAAAARHVGAVLDPLPHGAALVGEVARRRRASRGSRSRAAAASHCSVVQPRVLRSGSRVHASPWATCSTPASRPLMPSATRAAT
jgi:hypothetical protein